METESLTATVAREQGRLRNFIQRRVADVSEAEDLLQDVFSELVESTEPVEQVGAWLFRVARNRIVDFFRKKKPAPLPAPREAYDEAGERLRLEELLPAPDASPEAAYLHAAIASEMEAALAELPPAQREVFIAHELEGRSFKALSAETGVPVNTLLSRKHNAVLYLRTRLRVLYEALEE